MFLWSLLAPRAIEVATALPPRSETLEGGFHLMVRLATLKGGFHLMRPGPSCVLGIIFFHRHGSQTVSLMFSYVKAVSLEATGPELCFGNICSQAWQPDRVPNVLTCGQVESWSSASARWPHGLEQCIYPLSKALKRNCTTQARLFECTGPVG